jgi:hypothetical protein
LFLIPAGLLHRAVFQRFHFLYLSLPPSVFWSRGPWSVVSCPFALCAPRFPHILSNDFFTFLLHHLASVFVLCRFLASAFASPSDLHPSPLNTRAITSPTATRVTARCRTARRGINRPLRLDRRLELLGKQRKEFARGEGPLRAE